MARVRARQPELDAANTALVILSPEPVADLAPVARREGWTGPVVADPDREVYRAYGLGRLPWHRVFTPKTLLFYFGFMLRGSWPQPPGQDVRQQGGDFVVDGGGIARLVYVGRSSDDRPAVDDLIGCLRKMAGMPARSS